MSSIVQFSQHDKVLVAGKVIGITSTKSGSLVGVNLVCEGNMIASVLLSDALVNVLIEKLQNAQKLQKVSAS